MSRRVLLALAALLLAGPCQAESLTWSDLRDGSLYLQPRQNDTLSIDWRPAWQADAAEEHLYLLDGRGHLQGERRIERTQTSGAQRWPLAASDHAYQLEVPGYSFRRYRVALDAGTRAQFAPAKVHFSVQAPANTVLYFRVEAGEHASLAGKFHGGVRALHVERLDDGQAQELPLKPYRAYWQFDRLALPVAEQTRTYRLRLVGRGKAAFWLDGTANLFAQRAEHLGPLALADGQVALRVGRTVRGRSASLGVNVPYQLPPKASYPAIDVVQPRATGGYSFVDVLRRQPGYERPMRRFYQDRYPIAQDITLLAGSGRRAVLDPDGDTRAGLDAWLATSVELGGKALHYVAFADEPNLNYPDYARYARDFETLAAQVRRFPGAREAGVRIAMPASSNLVNGPLHEDSAARIGLDWARRLLASHGEQIDALAWHQWMVRDLLATRIYRAQVRQAAELVGLDAQGRPRKALLLDQTNISSGSNLSPYEQNTDFAGLWWASVAINASADGLLDMLNWFHLGDEAAWPKGMVEVDEGRSRFTPKPVALAHQFMQRHWLPHVLALDNDGFEVDALAMADGDRRSLFGVNKASRIQHLRVDGLGKACRDATLQLFGPDQQPRDATFTCADGQARLALAERTLFALTWTTGRWSDPPRPGGIMISALSTLEQYVRRKGLRRAVNGIVRRYVYRHEQLLWMERDLVTPVPPHSTRPAPPLHMQRITVHNAPAFARHFGDRVQTMRELAAEGHVGLMWLDEDGDACAFVWGSTRDYHDRHHFGCWFSVRPGEFFQFGGESIRRYWGTPISTEAQLCLWQVMRAQGCEKVVDVCALHNIPALRLHLRMGYREQGRIQHVYHLFGYKFYRQSRYHGSRLDWLRKAVATPSATAA